MLKQWTGQHVLLLVDLQGHSHFDASLFRGPAERFKDDALALIYLPDK